MKNRLLFRPESLEDLTELGYYIEKDSVDAAARLELAFVQTAHGLLEFPEAHAVYDVSAFREQGYRKVAIKGFPNHLIFYKLSDEGIEVCRVLHGARDLPRAINPDE
jgi:toxin ParE1/3/4